MKRLRTEGRNPFLLNSFQRLPLAVLLLLLCVIFCLHSGRSFSQSEPKRISFYAGQTSYSVPVLERGGTEYVGLLEILEPMGAVTARTDGKKWKLNFHNIDAQFEISKSKAKVHGKTIDLGAPLLIENEHGLVPIDSLKTILPLLDLSPVDFHEKARRVFIGTSAIYVSARKIDTGKVSFSFSAPVNPTIGTEPGKLRMVFSRDPLQSDVKTLTFDDKIIQFCSYSEANGSSELSVNASAPLTATFSDDRKVITVSAIQSPQPSSVPSTTQSQASSSSASPKRTEQPKPHPFVVIDAAHGGADRGGAIDTRVAEKDVTLSLAHRLRHELEIRGIASILVRDGDSALTAEQRASIANASGATLYLGLHASSMGTGVHVFYSNIQNESRSALAFVPVQTAQASRANQSRVAAVAFSQILSARGIKSGALPVSIAPLNSIATPALAVEMGSAGGSIEELSSPNYQQSVAVALAASVAALQSQGGQR